MSSFDHVIVGAGAAGCVLANRLTEDPRRPGAADRGGRQGPAPEHQDPGRVRQPVPHEARLGLLHRARARASTTASLYIPRGKSLGGSSSMNAMLYVRGRPLDYDLWVEAGADGLGLGRRAAVLHAARRTTRAARRSSTARAASCGVSEQRSPRPLDRALIDAVGGRRHPAHRRLQRARAGRRLDVPGHAEGRPALERRRRVPAARAEAPEPRGRSPARSSPASSVEGDARDRRALPRQARARAGRARRRARSSSPPARSARRSCSCCPASGAPAICRPSASRCATSCRAWARTSRTTRS